MDRLTALIIAFLAFFFLWLYDTGRWKDIKDILLGGKSNIQNTGFSYASYLNPTNQGGGGGGGGLNVGNVANDICKIYPAVCPFSTSFNTGKDIANSVLGIFGIRL